MHHFGRSIDKTVRKPYYVHKILFEAEIARTGVLYFWAHVKPRIVVFSTFESEEKSITLYMYSLKKKHHVSQTMTSFYLSPNVKFQSYFPHNIEVSDSYLHIYKFQNRKTHRAWFRLIYCLKANNNSF